MTTQHLFSERTLTLQHIVPTSQPGPEKCNMSTCHHANVPTLQHHHPTEAKGYNRIVAARLHNNVVEAQRDTTITLWNHCHTNLRESTLL